LSRSCSEFAIDENKAWASTRRERFEQAPTWEAVLEKADRRAGIEHSMTEDKVSPMTMRNNNTWRYPSGKSAGSAPDAVDRPRFSQPRS
jgi:hypothetical protein